MLPALFVPLTYRLGEHIDAQKTVEIRLLIF
ncbi:hypothetical protein N399_19435 [Bacillus licheniformis CG-B52]|nr:hypothetical protein N399_19435 [Bacillus licheniformis CG-B52]KUL12104.1 hypothetical protein LI17339_07620 [Bacillus licheniformis LMG 17339]